MSTERYQVCHGADERPQGRLRTLLVYSLSSAFLRIHFNQSVVLDTVVPVVVLTLERSCCSSLWSM